MKNKVLVAIVAVLAAALIAETGFIIGSRSKQRSQARSRPSVAPAQLQSYASTPQAQPQRQDLFDSFAQSRSGYRRAFDMLDAWDPFQEMERMQTRINRLFRDSFGRGMLGGGLSLTQGDFSFEPEIDMSDMGDHYLIAVDLPGIEKDKIDIQVEGGHLTLSGERRTESEDRSGNAFYKIERSYGSFARTIPLPYDADEEDVRADYVDGVIKVKIGKLAAGAHDDSKKHISVT